MCEKYDVLYYTQTGYCIACFKWYSKEKIVIAYVYNVYNARK